MDMLKDDAAIARAGWAGVLHLLVTKGVISESEAQGVILGAYEQAARRTTFATSGLADAQHRAAKQSGTGP